MKYTRMKIINMLNIILWLFIVSCGNSNNRNDVAEEISELTIHNATYRNGDLIIDIDNKSNTVYYMAYSYKGDLDKRSFPFQKEIKNDTVEISFQPFKSELIEKFTLTQKDKDPPSITADELGLYRIEKKEKYKIKIPVYVNEKYKKGIVKLYFSEYNQDDLSRDSIIYISPIAEMLDLFNFKEKIVVFRPD